MKKLLLLFAMAVGSLTAMADDDISANLKVESSLDQATLSVVLNNDNDFVAFQMDIVLPDGTYSNEDPSLVADRLGATPSVNLGDAGFVMAYNWVASNKIRLVCYNLSNTAIDGNAGDELFSLAISRTGALGSVEEWTAHFENVLFVTESALEEIVLHVSNGTSDTVAGESASTHIFADVDDDGDVDIVDVTLTLNTFLGTALESYPYADVDNDGDVDIVDVTVVLSVFLGTYSI